MGGAGGRGCGEGAAGSGGVPGGAVGGSLGGTAGGDGTGASGGESGGAGEAGAGGCTGVGSFGGSPGGGAPGGWPQEVVTALFSRFDEDGSGSVSYREFSRKLYEEEAKSEPPRPTRGFDPLHPTQPRDTMTGKLIGKPCFKGNEWLKGSNHIFDMNY